jgi:hypothetical protein
MQLPFPAEQPPLQIVDLESWKIWGGWATCLCRGILAASVYFSVPVTCSYSIPLCIGSCTFLKKPRKLQRPRCTASHLEEVLGCEAQIAVEEACANPENQRGKTRSSLAVLTSSPLKLYIHPRTKHTHPSSPHHTQRSRAERIVYISKYRSRSRPLDPKGPSPGKYSVVLCLIQ